MNEIPDHTISSEAAALENEEFLRGVKSSTCLLIPSTPSPSPMDFKHPLSEEVNDTDNIFLNLCENPKIIDLQNSADGSQLGDSSSSADSNSVVQDPISAQLINNISMLDYQTLSKNGDIIEGPPEICKLNGSLSGGKRKLPNFVNWNWPLIRKFLLWIVLSGLVACLGAIIALVITIPKTCNPDLPWFQGKVFYEVFPASFKDSNNDGIGDLKGLIKKLDYVQDVGGSAIRLNYIFEANNYPEQYYNTTSLLNIDRSLGTLKDFQDLIASAHSRSIAVILDIPVLSMVESDNRQNSNMTFVLPNNIVNSDLDQTSAAIAFWARGQKVDGFYLKNLEKFVGDVNFAKSLQYWKQIIGVGKIFIASEEAFNTAKDVNLQVFLNRIDLVDVHLDMEKGTKGLKENIDKIISSALWDKPYYPWVHWNIGNIDSERISTRHKNNSLALLAMEFVLPGTVSIFYGDEVGLSGLPEKEIEGDFHEHRYVHNLVPMAFAREEPENAAILPWNSKSVSEPQTHNLNVTKSLVQLKINTPTIYLNAIYKDGINMKNVEIRKTEENLIVIERWYPRRNTCVFVGNLGNTPITTDLSTMFYGGTVVAGTNTSLIGEVMYFDKVTFLPNSAIILKLEK